MFHRKSILRFIVVPTILMIVASATTLSFGTTTMKVQAQNSATPEQIKGYLTQVIQALDSGDNTKAIQQLKLATEQMDALTGVSSNGESDEGEGVEEGPGEDEDEPGDVDQNDEED